MKTWKFLTGTLVALVLCLCMGACSDDDYSIPTSDELVNTTWTGKDSGSMYNQILIFSKNKLTYIIRAENGTEYAKEEMNYTYKEEDGTFNAWSQNYTISGNINSAYMTIITPEGEEIILDKE